MAPARVVPLLLGCLLGWPAVQGVVIVRVAPEPRGQGLLLVGRRLHADDPAVILRLRGEEALEGGAGQFAGIPGVIRLDLRVPVVRAREAGCETVNCTEGGLLYGPGIRVEALETFLVSGR